MCPSNVHLQKRKPKEIKINLNELNKIQNYVIHLAAEDASDESFHFPSLKSHFAKPRPDLFKYKI